MVRIRRGANNYYLPSEAMDILRYITGDEIKSVRVGIREKALIEYKSRGTFEGDENVFVVPHTCPFFINFKTGVTVAFSYDEFLNSIVLRAVNLSFDDSFLEKFNTEETYLREVSKSKILVAFENHKLFEGLKIEKIKLLRYPINFKRKPIGLNSINEVGICFTCSGGKEFLIAVGMGEKYKQNGASILLWSDVSKDALVGLQELCLFQNKDRAISTVKIRAEEEFHDDIVAVLPTLGQSALEDLEVLKKVAEKSSIEDFQLLIYENGNRVFVDHTSRFLRGKNLDNPNRSELVLINKLIQAAENNVKSKITGS